MKNIIIALCTLCLFCNTAHAQVDVSSSQPLSTMNFLTIGTDARGTGMANAGVASSPDVNSHYWNPSKYMFVEDKGGVSVFYSPWLQKTTVKDMGLYALSGFYKIDSLQAVSSSFRYFSLGDVFYITEEAQAAGRYASYELAFDAAYARKLTRDLSASIAFRYAYSRMASNSAVSQINYKAGQAFAADFSMYYTKPLSVLKMPSTLSIGLLLSNIGTKVSYADDGYSYFLPSQLKLGVGISSALDRHNRLAFVTQIQKQMVPTDISRINDSPLSGFFNSFSNGASSMQWSIASEYDYKSMLKGRLGFFKEGASTGNRQYLSFGAGGKYKNIGLDVAYFVVTSIKEHPMTNTIQLSLSLLFP